MEEERTQQEHDEERGEEIEPDENHRPRRQARQQKEPQRWELPKRKRRLPAKFKDYILETAV